jgi:hypothetical protein
LLLISVAGDTEEVELAKDEALLAPLGVDACL